MVDELLVIDKLILFSWLVCVLAFCCCFFNVSVFFPYFLSCSRLARLLSSIISRAVLTFSLFIWYFFFVVLVPSGDDSLNCMSIHAGVREVLSFDMRGM